MKALAALAALLATAGSLLAKDPPPPQREANLSVRNETGLAIDKALSWLAKQQQPDGAWSNPELPALTALGLMALIGNPQPPDDREAALASAQRAAQFIRSAAQPDGGIYRKGLSTYNTAICLTALVRARQPEDDALTAKARDFLLHQQMPGGGFGYGNGPRDRADLSNTVVALESLSAYQAAHPGREGLDWKAALQFVQRCQNPASATGGEAGGFAYVPERDQAPAGTLRSTGTMSYAGLLSYIYADLQPNDERVTAAEGWIRAHYTLEENPAQGRDGYYYYLHLMAKGLAAAKLAALEKPDGQKVDWAHELALKLINSQSSAGSWTNADSARWMENDPVLVTSYAVLTLEIVWQQL